MDYLVRIFKSVANDRRVRILEYLLRAKEQTLEEIAENVRIPYKTIARNIKILEKAMMVKRQMRNGRALYSLEDSPRMIFGREIIRMIKRRASTRKRKG